MNTPDSKNAFDSELALYLESVARDDSYRVERVLKESSAERTELVWRTNEQGLEEGPYVRKTILRDCGLGSAYTILHKSWKAGARFARLPAVYDVHESGDSVVVLYEYIPGVTLYELVERTPEAERAKLACEVIPAICDAVHELHTAFEKPIVHRDLTPTNVICDPEAPTSLCLIDFGIARMPHEDAVRDTTIFGTRSYAPPEQFGFGQTDVRSDIYALGCLAFYCYTGRDPQANDRVEGYSDPAIPDVVRPILIRATQLDPNERYVSAQEFAAAFVNAQQRPDEIPPTGNQPAENVDSYVSNADFFGADNLASSASKDYAAPYVRDGLSSTFAYAHTQEQTSSHARRYVPDFVGRMWNVIVAALFLFLILASIYQFVEPIEAIAGYPIWVRAVAFFVLEPILFALIAWALLDKRRIRLHWHAYASTPKNQRRRLWLRALVCDIGCLLLVATIGGLVGSARFI